MTDEVNKPPHYTAHPSGVECIEITEHMNFCLGNAIKYIWRAGLKTDDPLKDLRKAAWYVAREIERLEKYTDLCGYAALAAECVSRKDNEDRSAALNELVKESEELGLYTSDWIKWEGGKCPVDPKTRVEVAFRDGTKSTSQQLAKDLDWRTDHWMGCDIIAYKVVK